MTNTDLNQPTIPQEQLSKQGEMHGFFAKIIMYWNKIAMVLLTFDGVYGLVNSLFFIVNDYPTLNDQLHLGLITESEANLMIARAFLLMGMTVFSIAMAIRLNTLKEGWSRGLDLLLATILIASNNLFVRFLSNFDLLDTITDFITKHI